ncbi:uncharacterized protein [Miscanthus floridulus]|uniref:uncharacterized protein n=1 Tax=Miscanthus floridulus TaxID=154761 RepID=UPI003459F5F3
MSEERAVSPMGSTVEVERATVGATPLSPRRVEEVLGSGGGQLAPVDTEAVLLSPPPPLQRRDAVKKRLGIRSSRKHQAEVPAFVPRKALKVGTGSIAPGAVDVQELVAQVGATQAAVGREEEEEPTLREATAPAAVEATVGAAETSSAVEATEGEVEVEAPSVVEATEGEVEVEAPSVVEATEGEVEVEASTVAEALWTSGAEVVEIAAPGNFGAKVVEAGMSAAALEVETEVRQASTLPPIQSELPVQGSAREAEVRPIPTDNASRGKGVADAGAASAVEQPASASGEGSAALVRVRPEPYGWDHPRIWWRSRDDPKGEPIFALEDRELLAHANELLSARSAEAEDLRLRCDNREAEAATAQGRVTPLATRVKELEEELTRVVDERDASNSRAEEARATAIATAGQLGAEQRAHELTKGALAEATKAAEELEKEASRAAEASRVEVQRWKEKAEASQVKVRRQEEKAKGLSDEVSQRLREALHTGVKRALAVVSSHYAGVDVEGVSDGYVLSEDAVEAEEELTRLEAAVEGPGTALAKLFEEEVVPPSPSADARRPCALTWAEGAM